MIALASDHSITHTPYASKSDPFTLTSLSNYHISEALLRSTDNGATLNLSKQNITDIGESGAEELASVERDEEDKSTVLRIALSNNHLTTLPMAFALLSRLRYLNLKNNNFSVFPDVLTLIASLDTLDISHNGIKSLPSQPGSLVNLKVFCLSRNKLERLPPYLCKFRQLNILKVDRNPIEYPPRSIVQPSGGLECPGSMMKWIQSLQRWMEDDKSRAKVHDDSGFIEQNELEHDLQESYDSWSRLPISESDFDDGVTPHARSFSVDSNFSISSTSESFQEIEPPSDAIHPERPPPLHLGILRSYSTETSPAHSPDTYLPSPAESFRSGTDPDDSGVASSFRGINSFSSSHDDSQQQHGRTLSYAGEGHNYSGPDLFWKKSMPDLRTAKLNFSKKRQEPPPRVSFKQEEEFCLPSPLSIRQDSGSSSNSNPRHKSRANESTDQPHFHSSGAPFMAFERNSYFRRLSTLPTAVISNTLPKPLLCLIDSARSILFAVCQVYLALEHYTVQATDDRLSNVLRKVLDPANSDMMQFINSLDRFDAMSRKMLPPPAVCRSVVESCKDTVSVFGKAVSVLALQLKLLANEDVRYLRSLLLTLYGAAAEISCAWQAMVPHIDAIKPLLHAKSFPTSSSSNHLSSFTSSDLHPSPASASMFQTFDSPPHRLALRSHSTTTLNGNGPPAGGIRMARRQAGSFSSKDVEIGKTLPSYEEMPSLAGGVLPGTASKTPIPRAPKRQVTIPVPSTSVVISSPSPTNAQRMLASVPPLPSIDPAKSTHSRQGSQASLQASSTSSSPSVPTKASFLDLPPSSKAQVDKEALHAMQEAVGVAPAVWDMMHVTLVDILESKPDVRDSLERAKAVTKRLSENIRGMQDGDAKADKKVLREDAHVFLKTVVQLSNVIKAHGGAGAVSSTLRSSMVKLTNATEEFAILLHVSSFSPSSTSRSYSPMLSTPATHGLLNPPEETRIGSSLSRSRSAQPSTSSRYKVPTQEPPRSALPSQSFKIPVVRRRGRNPPFDVVGHIGRES